MHILRAIIGVAFLCAIFFLCGIVQRTTHLFIPAGVLGLGLLYLLLSTRILPLKAVKPGADFLLAEMLLFFVPALVGVVRYFSVLATYGGRLLMAIVVGTICVMGSTALAVDSVYRLERHLKARRLDRRKLA